jgi:hypothetical protein
MLSMQTEAPFFNPPRDISSRIAADDVWKSAHAGLATTQWSSLLGLDLSAILEATRKGFSAWTQ